MIALAAALALALSLGSPPASCAPTGAPATDPVCLPGVDDALLARVQALLGSIDRPVTDEDWRRLPPGADALLEQLAADPQRFPTQRAKALDGLTARGADGALHERLAGDPALPFVLRSAGLRGVGVLLPASRRAAALGAFLTHDPDRRIRAEAAEVLSAAAPASCGEVRAQAAREGAAGRYAFARALARCGAR